VTDLESTGIAGLEQRYDRELAGRDGREVYVRDPAGDELSIVSSTPARHGADLELTLDRDLQAAAEAEVSKVTARTAPRVPSPSCSTCAPAASSPWRPRPVRARAATARPRRPSGASGPVTDQYEPGSTFKVTTVAAGLAERVITPATTIEVPHCMIRTTGGSATTTRTRRRPCRWPASWPSPSNIGTVKIADEYLSGDGEADHGEFFAPWIERLGFGRTTGIDLPGEAPGTVLPYDRWSGVSVTNIPIGQGIAVTPIQLAALYGMLASDGVWRRPHLVGRVGGGPRAPVATRRMLPRRVAREVNRMLEGVVADDGTGKLAAVPGYTVAGKTGTTQKLDPDGTYSVRRHIAFFVGFAPARDPRVVTLVLVDEPKGGDDYGGTVAAPVFAELMGRALRELRVPRR
jgi:cell division protein FtsI/penicillin-binding protein 2